MPSPLKAFLAIAVAAAIVAVALLFPMAVPAKPVISDEGAEISDAVAVQLKELFSEGTYGLEDGRQYEVSDAAGRVLSAEEGFPELSANAEPSGWDVSFVLDGAAFTLSSKGRFLGVGEDGQLRFVEADSAMPWRFAKLPDGSRVLVGKDGSRPFGDVEPLFQDLDAAAGRIDAWAAVNAGALGDGGYRLLFGDKELFDADGAVVLASKDERGEGACWDVSHGEGGYVQLASRASGLFLEAISAFPGQPVLESSFSGLPSQDWIAVPVEGGFDIQPRGREFLHLGIIGDALSIAEEDFVWQAEAYEPATGEGADKLVGIALEEYDSGAADGTYHEGGERYWSRFQDSYEAWCSEFVGWCLMETGLTPGVNMPSNPTYSNAYLSFYRDHPELGEVHENNGSYMPKPGDICLHGTLGEKPSHTELVVEVDGERYQDVSGNAGDKVKLRGWTTPANSGAAYYITINWEAALG